MDCNWDNPGHAPYRQHGVAHIERALNNYDLPSDAKRELLWKINSMQSDATVFISSTDIESAFGAASNLRDMHYKGGKCSGQVYRNSWNAAHREPALVYCSGQYCVAVPIVCGNISRIDYYPKVKAEGLPFYYEAPDVPANHVPEPGTLMLALFGLLALKKFT